MNEYTVRMIILLAFIVCGLNAVTNPQPPANFDTENAGSIQNPYQIDNLANLRWLSETQEVWGDSASFYYFSQTDNINAEETSNWNNGEGFETIGKGIPPENEDEGLIRIPFYGYYNGNGYKIIGLLLNRPNIYSPQGFFGITQNAVIENVVIENATVNSSLNAGLIVGVGFNTSITNCRTSGYTRGEAFAAGIIGQSRTGCVLSECYSSATIDGRDNCGGLTGIGENSAIINSYFTGELINTEILCGGIIGTSQSGTVVSNCYFAGRSSNPNDAGIIGGLYNSTLNNCFWDRELTDRDSAYFNRENSTVTNCQGLTTAQAKNSQTYINSGWDFENIWGCSPQINNGYPYLINNTAVVSTDDNIVVKPAVYISNFPNPFNPETIINYTLSANDSVTITILNIKGQVIKSLFKGPVTKGNHKIIWNGNDNSGKSVCGGIYLCRLKTSAVTKTLKLTLVK